jgi:excisionase family DNA binding protein
MSKSNPLRKWRTVTQVAEQCGVTPQAIRDAIKAGKIEAWPVGENLLIHKDQVPLFEKTRIRKIRQVGEGKFKMDTLPARGRRKAGPEGPAGAEERVLDHAKA